MLVRVLSLLIGAILGLSNSGVVWGAKDGIQPPGNGLIAFADAPGSKLGPEPWPDAHIFTVNPDGKNRKQLTTGPGGYLWPVWSPAETRSPVCGLSTTLRRSGSWERMEPRNERSLSASCPRGRRTARSWRSSGNLRTFGKSLSSTWRGARNGS